MLIQGSVTGPKGFFVWKAIDRGEGDLENGNGDMVNLDVMRSQNSESF